MNAHTSGEYNYHKRILVEWMEYVRQMDGTYASIPR